jgi:transketolase
VLSLRIQKPKKGVLGMKNIERIARGIRRRVLEYTLKNNGGYLSQACSSAEILAALYGKVMRLGMPERPIKPPVFSAVRGQGKYAGFDGSIFNGPKAKHLDRFFLSPSQYSLVLYALLVETGRMAPEGLSEFNKDGSTVEMIGAQHSPGMEIMSGSLGQGLSQAAGIAMARKLKKESGKVWVFMSDGEFQSGQTWEAVQTMSFYRMDTIGIYVDVNGCQCDGKMDSVMEIEPLSERLRSFGADVRTVDGHNIRELVTAAKKRRPGKPLFVLAYTRPYAGIPLLKRNAPKFHYVRFKSDKEKREYEAVLRKL